MLYRKCFSGSDIPEVVLKVHWFNCAIMIDKMRFFLAFLAFDGLDLPFWPFWPLLAFDDFFKLNEVFLSINLGQMTTFH